MVFVATNVRIRGLDRLLKKFERLPFELTTEFRRELARSGEKFVGVMVRKQFSAPIGGPPWYANQTRDQLHSRTGRLRNTMRSRVFGSSLKDLSMTVTVGDRSTEKRARAHETGPTVRPTISEYLTIPLPDNILGPSHNLKYRSARQLFSADPKNTFVIESKRTGDPIVAHRQESGELEFLWKLQRSVKLKKRLGLEKRWREYQTTLQADIHAALERVLRRVVGS